MWDWTWDWRSAQSVGLNVGPVGQARYGSTRKRERAKHAILVTERGADKTDKAMGHH